MINHRDRGRQQPEPQSYVIPALIVAVMLGGSIWLVASVPNQNSVMRNERVPTSPAPTVTN